MEPIVAGIFNVNALQKKLNPAIPYNDVQFVIRVYHLEESSNLDFYGYITLFFNNIDFVIFDTSSYALNILPIYSDTTLNGKHLIAD